ncbi:MAG: histidinol-phosphate aminotransferase family protein, partial [Candidatus Aenigmarchaeota archaeon]|nr:histidinol-phosphate aminotransferase family protein [Candidatus Aenigmarchaeota archaeon]
MFRENILEMEEYKPPLEGRSEGYLLLDFNERIVPPPRRIRRLLERYSKTGNIHIYPEYSDIDKIISDYAGVKGEQIIFTNGSDQGIDIIFRATVDKGDKV